MGAKYESVSAAEPTRLVDPLPYNLGFGAGPGDASVLLKVDSAYEAATRHRQPPKDFGPLASKSPQAVASRLRSNCSISTISRRRCRRYTNEPTL